MTAPKSPFGPLVGTATRFPLDTEDETGLVELDLDRLPAEKFLAKVRSPISLRVDRVSLDDVPKIRALQESFAIHQLTLLPVTEDTTPFTLKSIDALCLVVDEIQNAVDMEIRLENLHPQVRGADLAMTETRFINLLAKRVGCLIRLDLAQIYTNATNRCFNPYDWLDEINLRTVAAIGLSGTSFDESGSLENHRNGPVAKAVWDLYRYLCKQIRPDTTVIQWDWKDSPQLLGDVDRARDILRETAMYHFNLRSMGAPYQNVMEGGAA